MYEFKISGMTCGGCVNRVTKAVLSVDGTAKVDADISHWTVRISSVADEQSLQTALANAGYPVLTTA